MYGIMLTELGHKVQIFERSPETLLAQAGAGLQAPEDVEEFMRQYRLDLQPYYIPNPKMVVVDREGNLITTREPGVPATRWDTLYYRLRARFDGLETPYYDNTYSSLGPIKRQLSIMPWPMRSTNTSMSHNSPTLSTEPLVTPRMPLCP